MYELYGHYKRGFLLVEGGIADQPVWYLEAMNRMDAEFAELENAQAKAQRAAADAKGSGRLR